MKIDSGYTAENDVKLFYTINDDGFDIYYGEDSEIARYHQYEPFIPNHTISYEENAKQMCADLSEKAHYVSTPEFKLTEDMYTEMQSNIDYLMLLNDPDSATEEETE